MQHTKTTQSRVMQFPELRNMIAQKIAVSPDGFDTLKNFGLVDKMGNKLLQQHVSSDVWTKYVASRGSVAETYIYMYIYMYIYIYIYI